MAILRRPFHILCFALPAPNLPFASPCIMLIDLLMLLKRCSPIHQSLNNWHLRLLERLVGISTSCMWDIDGIAERDVVCERKSEGEGISIVLLYAADPSNHSPVREMSLTSTSLASHFPKSLTLPATGVAMAAVLAEMPRS